MNKLERQRTIAVDVDGTLMLPSGINATLIEWIKGKRARGFATILWSARGEAYARAIAAEHGIIHLFDVIVSKPGYIVDDKGWSWIRFTKWVKNLD